MVLPVSSLNAGVYGHSCSPAQWTQDGGTELCVFRAGFDPG